jgi:two-component system, OmpR family, alkaline phosphatase synthesis response regulator PhoP
MITNTKNNRKILVADDEDDILEIISYHLQKEGYEVHTATNGNDALTIAKILLPDLIILDVMMPFKNGFEVCEQLRLRKEFDNTLIVFLTALNDEESHIKGLELGSDDFITKPISAKIIASKINTLFRRYKEQTPQETSKILTFNHITLDPQQYIVFVNGNAISLARKEFELLYLLAGNPVKIFLRNEILNSIWGTDVIVGDRTIDVHIRKIRQKTGIDCIVTVKGVGYRFNNQ